MTSDAAHIALLSNQIFIFCFTVLSGEGLLAKDANGKVCVCVCVCVLVDDFQYCVCVREEKGVSFQYWYR